MDRVSSQWSSSETSLLGGPDHINHLVVVDHNIPVVDIDHKIHHGVVVDSIHHDFVDYIYHNDGGHFHNQVIFFRQATQAFHHCQLSLHKYPNTKYYHYGHFQKQ